MQQQQVSKKLKKSEIRRKVTDIQADVMGYLVYWSMSTFRIQHPEFVKYLQQVGIDPKKYGKEPTAKSIANQAVKAQTKGVKKFHRKTEDVEGKRTVYVLVNELVDQAQNFHHDQESKIAFNKEAKTLQVEGTFKREIESRFEAYQGTYNSEQFRNMALGFVESACQGVSIRDRGGVYFIPISQIEELEKLKALFKLVPGCGIECWPQYDNDEIKKSMWKAVTVDTVTKLQKFNSELDEMQGKKISTRVMQNRINAFKELKGLVGMYGELLSGTAQELLGGIAGVQQRLKGMIHDESAVEE